MGLTLRYNVCAAIVLLTIATVIQPGSAIKCWVCSSALNKDCGDPMNKTEHSHNFHTKNCDADTSQVLYGSDNKNVCKKIVQRENGQLVIQRSCALAAPDERDISSGPCGPHTPTYSHVTIESCHICNTDYCNGASSISGMQLFQACAIAFLTCALSPTLRSFF